LVAAVCVALVLTPHAVLTWKAFGAPFYNEGWRNLAFKLRGDWDWGAFHESESGGVFGVIASAPITFLTLWARELVKFFARTLFALGGHGLAGVLFFTGTLLGGYHAVRTRSRATATLLLFLVSFVGGVTAIFYTSPRFMLPVIPLCAVLVGGLLLGEVRGATRPMFGFGRFPAMPLVVLYLLVSSLATVRMVPVFAAAHPVAERDAIRALADSQEDMVVLGGWGPLRHHVPVDYRLLEQEPARALMLDGDADERARLLDGVDYVVLGRLSLRGYPDGLFSGRGVAPALTELSRTDDVGVYRVDTTTKPR
jgi:hypothetical protein